MQHQDLQVLEQNESTHKTIFIFYFQFLLQDLTEWRYNKNVLSSWGPVNKGSTVIVTTKRLKMWSDQWIWIKITILSWYLPYRMYTLSELS